VVGDTKVMFLPMETRKLDWEDLIGWYTMVVELGRYSCLVMIRPQ
jgi:hypothetical protein